jgi:hypothetical protein
MKTLHLFAAVIACGGLWAAITSVRIYDYLRQKNVPVSFLWLRVLIPKYLSQYRDITLKETGRAGPLFYHFVISINLALLGAIAALLSQARSG